MGRTRTRRLAFLAVAVLATAASACSVLTSTDGLAGGDGDGGFEPDSADLSLGDATPLGDSASGTSKPGPEASTAADSGVVLSPADAGPPQSDASLPLDAPLDTAPPPKPDAAPEAGADAHVGRDAAGCSNDLSDIGTAGFHIAFTLRTTQSGRAALLNQRSTCAAGKFWDLRFSSGKLEFEADDVSNDTVLLGTGPDLNDGATHTIDVTRVAGTITITIDGAPQGSTSSSVSFGPLPALATGVDVCDGQDGTVAFQGTLANVCVGSP